MVEQADPVRSPVDRRDVDTAVAVEISADGRREQGLLAARFERRQLLDPQPLVAVIQNRKLPIAHQQQVLTLVAIQISDAIGPVAQRPQFHLTPRLEQLALALATHHPELTHPGIDQHDLLAGGAIEFECGDAGDLGVGFDHVVLVDHPPRTLGCQGDVASELLLSHQDRLLLETTHEQLAGIDVAQLNTSAGRNRLQRSVGLGDHQDRRLLEVLEHQQVGSRVTVGVDGDQVVRCSLECHGDLGQLAEGSGNQLAIAAAAQRAQHVSAAFFGLRHIDNLGARLAVHVDQRTGQGITRYGQWPGESQPAVGHPADSQGLLLDADHHDLVPRHSVNVSDLHMSSVLETGKRGAQVEPTALPLPEDNHPGTGRIRNHHVDAAVAVDVAGGHVTE